MEKSNNNKDVKNPLTNCSHLATLRNGQVFRIKKTEYFLKWYKQLKDYQIQKKIAFRIMQTEQGNFGDFKFVSDGIFEMRIHYGPGYRLYYTKENDVIILLLAGGNKSTQEKDIKMAKELKNEKK